MQRSSIVTLIVGLITAAMGAAILLAWAGAFGPPQGNGRDPAWLGGLCGFIFLAGGAAVIIKAIFAPGNEQQSDLPPATPAAVRIIYGALGLAITVSLGVVIAWVAFGPGERHFSGSGAFLGPAVGRAAFGVGGIMIWGFLGLMGFRWARRHLARTPPGDVES
ncbi:MAG TPA: hypothetical protein VGF97_06950 [Rhizomicrobium sp.]|jgi:hypothetical protein